LHESVKVGPYSIIEAGAQIGEGCIIESQVRIYAATRLGRNNRVCHGVTLGSEPQDLGYTPAKSRPLSVGDHNHFKEGVNISRGVKSDQGTVIGSHNYLMAYSHAGHDAVVGDYNIFANTATLAGHVEVEHHVFLSGHTATHQFCRIGAYAMVAGVTGVPRDVPPYVIADGHRAEVVGLNLVGLRRHGFTQAQRNAIKRAYRLIYKSDLRLEEALERLEAEAPTDEVHHIVRFFRASRRGVIPHR
jgi:UDP-N-acetylglucosamine acyltransferase